MIINDLDGYYIVFDTKNWNTELDTLIYKFNLVLSEGYNLGTGDTITDDASFMVNSSVGQLFVFYFFEF